MRIKAFSPLVALLALTVTACETIPIAPGRSSSSPSPVEETIGVQELRREVAELRDTVEVQRNELEKLRERQRQLYDDLDYRLRQAEPVAGTGQGGTQGSGQGTSGQQQLGYGQSTETQGQTQGQDQTQDQQTQSTQQVYGQQGVDQGQQVQSQGGQQQGSQSQSTAAISGNTQQSDTQQGQGQVAVASAEEQAAYDKAFELLKQSRYNDAVIEFRSMIAQFPNGALVDDGQYWIGEAFYVTRDFENASTAFNTVVNRYPDSQRVPEAMLKLGYVQYELGQLEQAKQTLNQVIAQYPGSRVAISAETRLSKIR
jgi:tol-pal system protein YbgF